MSAKKKHENTAEEKKAIRSTVLIVFSVVLVLMLSVISWFGNYLSPDKNPSYSEKQIVEKIKWEKVLGEKTFKYTDSSVPEVMIPALFSSCNSVKFDTSSHTVFVDSPSCTYEGEFVFSSPNSLTISILGESFKAKLSAMSTDSYLMRITVENWGYLDFYNI